MTRRKPTQEELSSYFFNTCDEHTKSVVETWFYENGRSEEAGQMLFHLWQEADCDQTDSGKEDASIAFKALKRRLEARSLIAPSLRKKIFGWYARVAAVLLIPVLIFSLARYVDNQNESDIHWIEKSVSYGDIQKIILPDGTSVWLNAGSTIVYPDSFNSDVRQVFFDGEAYFDVCKGSSPFHVNTKGNLVKVMGTSFNLKAYRDDPNIDLSLFEGSVAFVPKTASESGPFEVVLSPGEYISYECESGKISHGCFSADDFSLWRQGGLYFKNKTLGEIVHQLERKYNVTIVITSPELKELRYHMAFVNNESIEQILDFIDQDSKIDIIRHGNIVELF